MSPTDAQAMRQKMRDRGRYSKYPPCEGCGKVVGMNYASDHRCNETGIGVTLCTLCAIKTEKMSFVEFASGVWCGKLGRPT